MSQAAGGGRNNFCYRHPGRQSFVLCQRCGRTICGECQTPAPVGVVCPECLREQRATAPKRAPLLTRLSRGGRPVVTLSIIAITLAVWVLQILPFIGPYVTGTLSYAGVYAYPQAFEPWRMLTVLLVHSTGGVFSIMHVALNMYTLWIFGNMLEPLLGRARFLALYLIAGFAGSVAIIFFSPPLTAVVGASGAIFGLFSAFIVIQRRLGGNASSLIVIVGLNLAIGFIPGSGISWQAHVGGLIGGALVGLIYANTRNDRSPRKRIALLGGLSLVLVALSLVRFVVQ